MGAKTAISWTDATWSPLRVRVKPDAAAIAQAKGYTSLVQIAERMAGHVGQHCEHVSHGCDGCYSEREQHRCLPSNGTGLPFDRRSRDLVEPFLDEKVLTQPLRWKSPKRIFVANQTDLFGEWYTDEMIDRVFAVMAFAAHHTFQCLTKRHGRMSRWASGDRYEGVMTQMRNGSGIGVAALRWPLPNVWLGVSCEDQKTWDERVGILSQVPAAVRFVSLEPQLSAVDCAPLLATGKIHQAIQGGESGHDARPFDISWARTVRDQCKAAGVAYFLKQVGAAPFDVPRSWQNILWPGEVAWKNATEPRLKHRAGADPSEWPEDLRVQEYPEVAHV